MLAILGNFSWIKYISCNEKGMGWYHGNGVRERIGYISPEQVQRGCHT